MGTGDVSIVWCDDDAGADAGADADGFPSSSCVSDSEGGLKNLAEKSGW